MAAPDAALQQVLRQAQEAGREAGLQGVGELQQRVIALQQHIEQLHAGMRAGAANAAGPGEGALRDRLAQLERQVQGGLLQGVPPGAPLQFVEREAQRAGVQFAGQFGHIKMQPPPNFVGTNNPDEWDNFSFKLKMYLGITMPAMVTNMEHAEEGGDFIFDNYPQDVQDQARALMALLGSLCTDSSALFVRSQVEAGNKNDGFQLWYDLKQRFTLRQTLTTVGLLERIMAWPINETNVRQELPKWESAIQKFESRSGQPLSDTLKIGFLRKNLGATIRNHLRLNSHLLTDYNTLRELIVEWNRFEDFDTARSNPGGLQPMDIGWIGKGRGKGWTTWNPYRKSKGKGKGNY